MWAFAKLHWAPDDATWAALAARAAAVADEMKPQELSILLWSVASLGLQLPRQEDTTLQKAVLAGAEWFQAQSISNSLWALARLAAAEERLNILPGVVGALVEAAAKNAWYFSAQGLANTLWGCAQLGAEA